jgi:hypothetical protein
VENSEFPPDGKNCILESDNTGQKVESHKAARFGLLHLLRSIWKRKKNQSSQIHNKQAQKNIEMLRPTSSVLYFET